MDKVFQTFRIAILWDLYRKGQGSRDEENTGSSHHSFGKRQWFKTLRTRGGEPPKDGLGEREMLEAWLEFHRMTLLLKCEGLDGQARKARPVTTSKLSLHGLVRHMAEVERLWFRRVLQREPGTPYL